MEPAEAYDLWCLEYDDQPGNLVLELDELIFSHLLAGTELRGKIVFDIGCGTGRHWNKIIEQQPAQLTGFDVSTGMLLKLKAKFPAALVKQIDDGSHLDAETGSCDFLFSTLTIAHIKNIVDVLKEWCRLLKQNADIIITDFHPNSLILGAQRTFRHKNKTLAVQNYIHRVEFIKELLFANGFRICSEETRKVDESVKHFYAEKSAMNLYDRFYGIPIIYGLHFTR